MGVHIANDLTWSHSIVCLIKKVHQHLYFLRRLGWAGLCPSILISFYRCMVESILISCITVWYSCCSAADRRALKQVVKSVQWITGSSLPTLWDIYTTRHRSRVSCIMADAIHPANRQFVSTSRLRNSVYPDAVRLLNTAPLHN